MKTLVVVSGDAAVVLDLTISGNSGTINGAIYQEGTVLSGTGGFNTFVEQQPQGSGKGNMFLYVLSSCFGSDDSAVVTLYSEFGGIGVLSGGSSNPSGVPDGNYGASDGFDEIGVGLRQTDPVIPEPATVAIWAVLGMLGMCGCRRVRRRR